MHVVRTTTNLNLKNQVHIVNGMLYAHNGYINSNVRIDIPVSIIPQIRAGSSYTWL